MSPTAEQYQEADNIRRSIQMLPDADLHAIAFIILNQVIGRHFMNAKLERDYMARHPQAVRMLTALLADTHTNPPVHTPWRPPTPPPPPTDDELFDRELERTRKLLQRVNLPSIDEMRELLVAMKQHMEKPPLPPSPPRLTITNEHVPLEEVIVVTGNPICVLCSKECENQYGNNPHPLSDTGKCCDGCNENVLTARLATMSYGNEVYDDDSVPTVATSAPIPIPANDKAPKKRAPRKKKEDGGAAVSGIPEEGD